ncbi:hypothetical protein AB3S75_019817 [Citrus x aurantiifolia]
MSPMIMKAQFGSKRNRSSRTSSKPPQSRKMKALRSKVWKDFTKLPKYYNRCKCNYCSQEYSCKSTDGTSSLSNHLKMCFEYESYVQNQAVLTQEPTGAGNKKIGQVVVRGFNQEAIRKATTKMIILDELLFSHVEYSRFRHFSSIICPRFVAHLVEPLLRISLTYF